jgi:hypothetical protein
MDERMMQSVLKSISVANARTHHDQSIQPPIALPPELVVMRFHRRQSFPPPELPFQGPLFFLPLISDEGNRNPIVSNRTAILVSAAQYAGIPNYHDDDGSRIYLSARGRSLCR